MSGQALQPTRRQAVDPQTGAIIDLADCSIDQLAQLADHSKEFRGRLTEFDSVVSDELVARLDAAAQWTWHGSGYTITAPSPSRDAEQFPPDALEAALRELVETGVVTVEAAGKAMKRLVTLKIDVPITVDLAAVREALTGWTVRHGEIELPVVVVSSHAEKALSGINQLRKNPAAKERIDEVAIPVRPERRAKVVGDEGC